VEGVLERCDKEGDVCSVCLDRYDLFADPMRTPKRVRILQRGKEDRYNLPKAMMAKSRDCGRRAKG